MNGNASRKGRTALITLGAALAVALLAVLIVSLGSSSRPESGTAQVTIITTSVSTQTITTSRPVTTSNMPPVTTTTTTKTQQPAPAPTATQSTSSLKLPEVQSAQLQGAESVTLFDRITVPEPKTWAGTSTDDPDSMMRFAEITTCNVGAASLSRCPHIDFVNLATPQAKTKYGSDMVAWWRTHSCEGTAKNAVEGPATFKASGASAQFYRHQCTADEYSMTYLWVVPGKQLAVMAKPGEAGSLSDNLVQTVLADIKWGV